MSDLAVPMPSEFRTFARRGAPRAAGHVAATLATGGAPPADRLALLGPTLFHDALRRERRRADRDGHAFSVLLVEVAPGLASAGGSGWAAVTQAMAAATRATDLLGWFDPRSVMGLVLTEIDRGDGTVPEKVERRVRQELARRLGDEVVEGVSIRRYTHAGGPLAAGEGSPVDPLLEAVPVRRHARAHAAAKRALDVAGSLGLLLALAPVYAIVAGAVMWSSPGPVFFRQERVGRGGRPFRMLKFRTMFHGAGHGVHQDYVTWFITQSDKRPATGEGVFKLQHDARVTPVGRFLRRSSLDELPQFWNVLRGEMSLVGPRPPLPFEVAQYQPWHRRRVLDAVPGVTGLWQVKGRSRTTFDEMVRLDLQYAKAPTIWTDIRILAATPRAVITGKGAC